MKPRRRLEKTIQTYVTDPGFILRGSGGCLFYLHDVIRVLPGQHDFLLFDLAIFVNQHCCGYRGCTAELGPRPDSPHTWPADPLLCSDNICAIQSLLSLLSCLLAGAVGTAVQPDFLAHDSPTVINTSNDSALSINNNIPVWRAEWRRVSHDLFSLCQLLLLLLLGYRCHKSLKDAQ